MSKRNEAAQVADFILKKIGFVLAAAAGTFLMFPGIVHAADAWEPDVLPGTGVEFNVDGTWFDRALDAEGDEDWFELNVAEGSWYTVEAQPFPSDAWVDTYMEVFDFAGTLLAEDDDSGMNLMPSLLFQADRTETLDIKVRGYSIFTTGEYSARAQEVVPAEISGKVVSPNGDPLNNVEVTLYRFHDGIWWDTEKTSTTSDGGYSFDELAEGTYRIGYFLPDSLFPPIYYPGVQSADAAERIVLNWGDQVVDADQRMQTSALISGTALNWNGTQTMGDVKVSAYLSTPAGFEKVEEFHTATNGTWSGQLAEGTYRFEFVDSDGVAVRTYYPDASVLSLAQDVEVDADGASLTVRMPQYANLDGTVRDALTGAPVASAWIDAYRMTSSGPEYFDGALSGSDGHYEIGMYTGTYVIAVHTDDNGHLAFVSNETISVEDGTRIAIGPEGESLDFELTPASDICGDVNDIITEDIVPGATVVAERLVDGEWVDAGEPATAGEEGDFLLRGLAEGTYRIRASHPSNPDSFWFAPGVRAAEDADVFNVGTGTRVRTTVGVSEDALAPVTTAAAVDQVAPVTVLLGATDGGSGVESTFYRVDGVEWLQGTEAIIGNAGHHVVEFYSEDVVGNVEEIKTVDVYAYATSLDVSTLAGDNRYQTAVEVSKDTFPDGADSVVVASGRTWADGLSASALAGALDAPILLVPMNAVPGEVAGEVARLAPKNAWIVGGEGVVGPEIQSFLAGAVDSEAAVTRLGGADRYATAAMVAEALVETVSTNGDTWDGTYILASGTNFPDALAVSPIAASKSWPILLTGANGLNAKTAEFLRTSGAKDGIVLGGCGAVCTDTAAEAEAITGGTATRVAGTDRYMTALEIARYAQEHTDLGTGDIAVASGQSFPDALTSGVRQARNGSILVLTPAGNLHSGVADFLQELDPETARRLTFVGGVAAVSQEARASVLGALEH